MSEPGWIIKGRQYFIKVAGNRILQHLLFWAASFLFLVNFFSTSNKIEKIDYIYTALFHFSLLFAVYGNIWLLIPALLKKGRYLIYILGLSVLVSVSVLLNHATFEYLVDIILPEYYFISFYDLADILKFIFVYVSLSTLLKLSKGWFLLMQAEQQMMRIRQEKVETELKALKSQINPHFLFNSLNNIYSLAMGRSGKTPEAILKLSDLIRYMLYESNSETVPLGKEIEFLHNYIDLQRLRSDNQSTINFKVKGAAGKQKIAPLLFLPLVENSFKHGVKGDPKGGFVKMHLEIAENAVHFHIENNAGQVDNVEKDEYNGIGLANVKRRLELLYPGKNRLEIQENEDIYSVELLIEL